MTTLWGPKRPGSYGGQALFRKENHAVVEKTSNNMVIFISFELQLRGGCGYGGAKEGIRFSDG
jgi:hypothetical protein